MLTSVFYVTVFRQNFIKNRPILYARQMVPEGDFGREVRNWRNLTKLIYHLKLLAPPIVLVIAV